MVVGAISSVHTLTRTDLPRALKLDIAELRLDLTGFVPGWDICARQLRDAGIPVLLTLRSPREGGRWAGDDAARLSAYLNFIAHVSAVDVEINSEIAESVARAAFDAGKPAILSFHEFSRTPPVAELRRIIDTGFSRGASLVKIAALTETQADVEILSSLLHGRGDERLLSCVGMGACGAASRVELALAGSCLTYGFADDSNAPGQISSEDLLNRLRSARAR